MAFMRPSPTPDLVEDRFRPSARLLNKTATSGFSYLNPQTCKQQQHLAAARSMSAGGGYNSLPRHISSPGSSAGSLTQVRRKLVNSALQDYLKSLNAMTRSIVLETETVEKENQCNWTNLDNAKKEDLVNDHFVPAGIRMRYNYEQERASSCCSFSSVWSTGHGASQTMYPPHRDGLVMENRSMHSSHPDVWENISNHGDRQLSRSTKDLVYTNDWSSVATEEHSLSQPSPFNSRYDNGEDSQSQTFNRLHKTQLSFRPSKQHAVRPKQSSQQQVYGPRKLGSDGESSRTSDEDYEGIRSSQNSLGFQRTKLRSYSMRSKRGNGNTRGSANLRSSVRTSNKIRTSPDGQESSSNTDFYKQQSRPSHYHTYSTTSNETDFDEEIDMPDIQLLLDHVTRKTSTDETDSNDDYKPPQKHSRARRSFRGGPKVILDNSEIIHNSSLCSGLADESADNLNNCASQDPSQLYCSHSRDSFDMDSVSMAPSELSKYPMDDEESLIDQSRMTPDSILSVSSYSSSRPRSKAGEIAVLRNRRGKRGGSHVQVATSNFANRHTQFKNNQKHQLDYYQLSASTTRATSPASSVSGIPAHCQDTYEDRDGYLKAPNFTFSTSSKHNSVAESTTSSDMPHSPVSLASSSPTTPLAISPTSHSHLLLRKSMSSSCHEHRESGYASSSSESFPVPVRQ